MVESYDYDRHGRVSWFCASGRNGGRVCFVGLIIPDFKSFGNLSDPRKGSLFLLLLFVVTEDVEFGGQVYFS
jgi:hypothetical protein